MRLVPTKGKVFPLRWKFYHEFDKLSFFFCFNEKIPSKFIIRLKLAQTQKFVAKNKKMNIHVNHESKSIAETSNLNMLLSQLNISRQGIAVAINNQIITKTQWEQTLLSENDNVTIITATQGG